MVPHILIRWPGFEGRWLRDFPILSILVPRTIQTPLQWFQVSSRDKAAGAWRRPPTPSQRKGRKQVELQFLPSLLCLLDV